MKVCFVSHTARLGGAERSLLETVRVLRAREIDCAVLLPSRGPLLAELERIPVPCRVLPYRWWSAYEGGRRWKRLARLVWNLGLVLPAAVWLRRQRAEIVYSNTVVVCIGAWAAAVAGRRHVWHLRELGHAHNRMVFDLGERWSLDRVGGLSDLVLANSHCVAERYAAALAPRRARVIYQGVQLPAAVEPWFPVEGDGFRCAVVGSIGRSKRQEEAIRAVRLLDERGLRVRLAVVGEGDPGYTRELQQLVARLAVEDRVEFLGQLPSAIPVIAGADALVHCSRHEAFGRVTVEGMLAGKPVVGARSGGTAELIRDGQTGLLYEPGDVAQLAGLLQELAARPERARQLGERARAWARDRFTERRFGDELLDCLRPLAG
jgi:glycosyltransferase involved in cell wall biosynthesis